MTENEASIYNTDLLILHMIKDIPWAPELLTPLMKMEKKS